MTSLKLSPCYFRPLIVYPFSSCQRLNHLFHFMGAHHPLKNQKKRKKESPTIPHHSFSQPKRCVFMFTTTSFFPLIHCPELRLSPWCCSLCSQLPVVVLVLHVFVGSFNCAVEVCSLTPWPKKDPVRTPYFVKNLFQLFQTACPHTCSSFDPSPAFDPAFQNSPFVSDSCAAHTCTPAVPLWLMQWFLSIL